MFKMKGKKSKPKQNKKPKPNKQTKKENKKKEEKKKKKKKHYLTWFWVRLSRVLREQKSKQDYVQNVPVHDLGSNKCTTANKSTIKTNPKANLFPESQDTDWGYKGARK